MYVIGRLMSHYTGNVSLDWYNVIKSKGTLFPSRGLLKRNEIMIKI